VLNCARGCKCEVGRIDTTKIYNIADCVNGEVGPSDVYDSLGKRPPFFRKTAFFMFICRLWTGIQRRQSQELVVDKHRKVGDIHDTREVNVTFSLTLQRRQGQELVVDKH
jgi:hypothetical protein